MTGCKVFKPFNGFKGFPRVPVGCRMKHGKRQAWTPMTGCKGRP